MMHVVRLTPGAVTRVDGECPVCGWADRIAVTLYALEDTVRPVITFRTCLRCAKEHQ